jgi:perosamine synthetase
MTDTVLRPTQFEPGAHSEGMIPLCVPQICGNEWKYVKECLDTNWVSSVGAFVNRFEEGIAEYVGSKFAVATVNGTAALHTALIVAGVRADDEVLVSTLTFIAPANAVRYIGAWPVFIDAEPQYWQFDVSLAIEFLEKRCTWRGGELRNSVTGRRVKAIVPVHILGHPVDLDPLLEVARKYDLVVVEDATESLGAQYKGNYTGSIGDIGCFSFNGNKVITTGGGGMIVTNNQFFAERARYLTTQAKDDPVEYRHSENGFNYRLTNIQAALGCAQLEKLDLFLQSKRRIAELYNAELADLPGITIMSEAPWANSIFWLYTALFDPIEFGENSRTLMARLNESGIQSRPLWEPLHRSLAFKGCQSYGGRVAEDLNQRGLSLPSSSGLNNTELDLIINHIKRFGR